MNELNNEKLSFEVLNSNAFSPSEICLNQLYQPIVGVESIAFYNFLLGYNKIPKIISHQKSSIFEIIKNLSISNDNFQLARKKLEAVNLLKTYYNEFDKVLIFELLNPLTYEKFILDHRLYNLLAQKVSNDSIEFLKFSLSNRKNYHLENEITSSILEIFPNDKFDHHSFNFKDLLGELYKMIGFDFILDEEVKNIIDSYFKNYHLSLHEIKKSFIDSLIINQSKKYEVDQALLISNLENFISKINDILYEEIVDLNRDQNIFLNGVKNLLTSPIFLDYRNLKSEKYISSIKKGQIDTSEVGLISKMRRDFKLKDEVINIIIDFSIYKTHGRLNFEYILKTVQTITNFGYNTIEKVYDYFLSLSNKTKILNNKIKNTDHKLVEIIFN